MGCEMFSLLILSQRFSSKPGQERAALRKESFVWNMAVTQMWCCTLWKLLEGRLMSTSAPLDLTGIQRMLVWSFSTHSRWFQFSLLQPERLKEFSLDKLQILHKLYTLCTRCAVFACWEIISQPVSEMWNFSKTPHTVQCKWIGFSLL